MRENGTLEHGLQTSDRGPLTSVAKLRGRRSEVRGRFARALLTFLGLVGLFSLLSCSAKPDPNTLVMIIESSPTNLDPRVGIEAQSERIADLIFDDLLTRDSHLHVGP